MARFIDINIIQTLPVSCANRDDVNRPKTSYYGGAQRARLSSQSIKAAVRPYFNAVAEVAGMTGYRTKTGKILDLITKDIMAIFPDFEEEKAREMAGAIFELVMKSKKNDADKEKKESDEAEKEAKDVLFLISKKQVHALAELAVRYNDELAAMQAEKASKKDLAKKAEEYKELAYQALRSEHSIEEALFGRMSATETLFNTDAACMVAHAISTHEVQIEQDYFTVVDDLNKHGAGHIGTKEFVSATMYRFASINVDQLLENMTKEEAVLAASAFIKAFIMTLPGGSGNTYAHLTVPNLVYVAVRDDQYVNLATAFETPVRNNYNGYMQKSLEKFKDETVRILQFVDPPVASWAAGYDIPDTKNVPVREMIDAVKAYI